MLTIQALHCPIYIQHALQPNSTPKGKHRTNLPWYHQSPKKPTMMSTRVGVCLALAFFFFGAHGAKVAFMNKCPYTVWPGTLAVGSNPQLSKTGFELSSGQSTSLDIPAPLMGQFWARTGCSTKSGKFACETADCGSGQLACKGKGAAPPATLAELQVAANSGKDSYAINSFSKGFNVPISIAPQGGTGDCKPSSCPANINAACPPKLQQKGPDGKVVGCKSACVAFNDPKYCCTGAFNTADKCPPTQYSQFFKKQCPQAYSYAFDDKSSTFTCFKGPNYTITFCPS